MKDSRKEKMTQCDSLPEAERYIEKYARIIKLPCGGWRVWLQRKIWYGSRREDAVLSAAKSLIRRYD